MNKVLVIITNFMRPANVSRIIEAFAAQSVPCTIKVVDNSPRGAPLAEWWHYPAEKVADIWRFTENHGPPCRFAPALLDHTHPYTLFYDDDLLPGPLAVENLLEVAEKLNNNFANLGMIGRRFRPPQDPRNGRGRYLPRNIERLQTPVAVDMTCRTHFVKTCDVRHAINFKWDLIDAAGKDISSHVFVHDDMLLCLGIQHATGLGTYIIPACEPDRSLKIADLPDAHAVSIRRGDSEMGGYKVHLNERSELVDLAERVGWKSRWATLETEMRGKADIFT